MNHILMTLLVSSLLVGCTDKLVVKKEGVPLAGIPFRVAESWKEYFMYTTIEENGKSLPRCRPQLHVRVLDNVPSSELYTIAYGTETKNKTEIKTQWFAKQKFAVTLHANGTLASVNVESTPPSPKELAEVAQIVAGLPMFVPTPEKETSEGVKKRAQEPILPPCTGTPQYINHCQIRDKKCEKEVQKVVQKEGEAVIASIAPLPLSDELEEVTTSGSTPPQEAEE